MKRVSLGECGTTYSGNDNDDFEDEIKWHIKLKKH